MKPVNTEDFRGDFFKVLAETDLSQVATMTIEAGHDSGAEGLHQGDQIVFIIEGEGVLEVDGTSNFMKKGHFYIIPKRTKHKMYNRSQKPLFFFNVYTPPEY